MGYEFPPRKSAFRRELAATVVWSLKLQGDILSKTNAVAVLEKRLKKLGLDVPNRAGLTALLTEIESEEWGSLVLRDINGRRTQGIFLVESDEAKIPDCPAVLQALTAPEPEPTASVADERATENELDDEYEPFSIPPELRNQSTVLDKLFLVQSLLNEATIQAASATVEVDDTVPTRLAETLEQNSVLRRKLRDSEETVRAKTAENRGLHRANATLQSNYDALAAAARVAQGTDGYRELARMAQERPRSKG